MHCRWPAAPDDECAGPTGFRRTLLPSVQGPRATASSLCVAPIPVCEPGYRQSLVRNAAEIHCLNLADAVRRVMPVGRANTGGSSRPCDLIPVQLWPRSVSATEYTAARLVSRLDRRKVSPPPHLASADGELGNAAPSGNRLTAATSHAA